MKTKIFVYLSFLLFGIPSMLNAQTTMLDGNLKTTGWLKTLNGNLILNNQIIDGSHSGYLLFCSDHESNSGIGLYDLHGKSYGYILGTNGGSVGITDSLNRWTVRSQINDFIEFRVADQEKMRINNDGSMLIGTQSNPDNHKLAIAGDMLVEKIKLGTDSTTYGYLKGEANSIGLTDASEHWVIRSSNDFIEFRVADQEKMRINNDGSVLIGTENPGNLTVTGDVLAEKIKLGSDSTTYGYLKSADNGNAFGLADSQNRWIIRSSMDDYIEFRIADEEEMRITGDGNMLIGTQSNPGNHKLAVAGDILAEEMRIGEENDNKATIKYEYHDHDETHDSSYWHLMLRASSDPTANSLFLAENGTALIGVNDPCRTSFNSETYLYVGGEAIKADGNSFWTYTSDLRLKTDIEPLHNSLEKLMDVNFYSYKYLETDDIRYGILAQEMQEIMPRSVGSYIDNTDGNEYLNFNPNDLFFTGLKATQEIGEQVIQQEEIINTLIDENAELRNELDQIKVALAKHGIELQDIDTGDSGLEQNQPNPFSHTTIIPYTLPETGGHAVISVHDMAGRIVHKEVLPNQPGKAQVELDLSQLNANGTYFYSLHIGNKLIDTKQMVLVK